MEDHRVLKFGGFPNIRGEPQTNALTKYVSDDYKISLAQVFGIKIGKTFFALILVVGNQNQNEHLILFLKIQDIVTLNNSIKVQYSPSPAFNVFEFTGSLNT